jgi:hypothetical protein
MAESLQIDPTAPSVAAPDLPPAVVSLTKDELSKMLAAAVAAGAAQYQAANALGAAPIVAEVPEDWTPRQLLMNLVNTNPRWFTERDHRSAQHAVDLWYPAEEE